MRFGKCRALNHASGLSPTGVLASLPLLLAHVPLAYNIQRPLGARYWVSRFSTQPQSRTFPSRSIMAHCRFVACPLSRDDASYLLFQCPLSRHCAAIRPQAGTASDVHQVTGVTARVWRTSSLENVYVGRSLPASFDIRPRLKQVVRIFASSTFPLLAGRA